MSVVEANALRGWSGSRWGWTVFLVFLLHLTLIEWWSETPVAPRPPRPEPARGRWVWSEPERSRLALELAVLDPALFALPRAGNFSGSAWLRVPPLTNHVPGWRDTAPPPGLEAPLALGTGQVLAPFVAAYPLVATKPEPRWFDAVTASEPLPAVTVVRIEGPLSARPVTHMPEWRVWPSPPEGLAATALQLWVDAAGWVRDVGLWSESGLPEADQEAVRAARQLRFAASGAPAPGENRLCWGLLTVQWGISPAAGAHAPRTAP